MHMTMELAPPSKDTLQKDAVSWATKAQEVKIVDKDSCLQASYLLRSIKGLRADIQKHYEPHIERAMETKRAAEASRKALVDELNGMEAPLVAAELVVKQALLAWDTAQEEARKAEERRLQAEAQALAEQQTIEAAAQLEREARATGDLAMLEEAHSLMEQPVEASPVYVKPMMAKVDGVVYRDNWTVHPTVDLKLLARAVADGIAPVSFLTANMVALRQWAKASKGGQRIPGVKVINDRQVAARG